VCVCVCVFRNYSPDYNHVTRQPIKLASQEGRSKEYYDRNTNVPLLAVGEEVLLDDENVRRSRSAKLCPPWIGPYGPLMMSTLH
jgi:hypothetical protein